jgi:hypothetical protein
LDDPQSGTEIDGGILIEPSAFEEIGYEFNIDLEQVSRAGDDKGSAVAFGS